MVKVIKAVLLGRARFYLPHASQFMHKGDFGLHMGYFGGAFMEGHGFYRWFAGALFVMGLLGVFVHDAEEMVH